MRNIKRYLKYIKYILKSINELYILICLYINYEGIIYLHKLM